MNELIPVVCPFCGVGCGMYLQRLSGGVIATVPSRSDVVSEGRLCVRGWQTGDLLRNSQRLTSPLVDGRPVSWPEALEEVTRLLRQILGSRVGILTAGHLTNEEGAAVSYFGREVLGTAHLDNFGRMVDGPAIWGLQYSLGQPYQRPSVDTLPDYDLVVCLNSNLGDLNAQAGTWVHKAQQAGTKLIVIDAADDGLGQDAQVYVQHIPGATAALLRELLSQLNSQDVPLPSPDLAKLGPASLSEALLQTTEMMQAATRVAIVLSTRAIATPEPAIMAAEVAKYINGTDGHHAEVFAVGGTPNAVGLIHMGVAPRGPDSEGLSVGEMLAREQQGLDGLIVIGEELGAWLGEGGLRSLQQRLQALIVIDSFLTPTTKIAHIALPMAGFGEKEGSFTGLYGQVRWSGAVAPPSEGCRYLPEILSELATGLDRPAGAVDVESIWQQINQLISGYENIQLAELRQEGQAPLGQTVLVPQAGSVELDYEPLAREESTDRPYTLISRYDENWWTLDGRVPAVPALYREARDLQAGYALMNPADMEKEQVRPGRSAIIQTVEGGGRLALHPHVGIPEGYIVLPAHQLKFLQRLMGFGRYDGASSAIYRRSVAAELKKG